MADYDIVIVGGGPAGAFLSYLLSSRGYRVALYDMAPRLGIKPCGCLVPAVISEIYNIPEEFIISRVKGYRVYLDLELIHEGYGETIAYHIDKPKLLNYLASSVDIRLKSYVNLRHPVKELLEQLRAREAVVVATGALYFRAPSEKIYAVQTRVKVSEYLSPEIIELYFQSDLVGYYWVFPESERIAKVGVGGCRSPSQLVALLQRFLRLKGFEPLEPIRGSYIVCSKPLRESVYSLPTPTIGEAAGFVMPISGEGIRPSMISAYALYRFIEASEKPKILDRISRWISVQYNLLNKYIKASKETRVKLLKSIPIELAMKLAFGDSDFSSLLSSVKNLPFSILSILLRTLIKA